MTLPKALQQSLRCPLLSAVSECAVSPAMHRSAHRIPLSSLMTLCARCESYSAVIVTVLKALGRHSKNFLTFGSVQFLHSAAGEYRKLSSLTLCRKRVQRPVWAERGEDHSETFYTIKLVNGQEKVVRKSLSQARTSKK